MSTVLVIDDSRNQRLLYEQELEEEGYRVILAEDAEDAVAQLEIHTPDLVVVGMGGMALWDMHLLQRLQNYREGTAIVANTTRFDDRDLIAGLVDAYVLKSSNLTPLKGVIRVLLLRPGQHAYSQHLKEAIAV